MERNTEEIKMKLRFVKDAIDKVHCIHERKLLDLIDENSLGILHGASQMTREVLSLIDRED